MLTALTLTPLATLALGIVGCHDSSSSSSGGGGGSSVARAHTNIVLRDRLGNALQVASTEPYSPRQTCGACHDIDAIANGFHFQQGRTDANGNIQTADDFFNDNRPWLKSDGMYGKW
jgi:hypothetical protein